MSIWMKRWDKVKCSKTVKSKHYCNSTISISRLLDSCLTHNQVLWVISDVVDPNQTQRRPKPEFSGLFGQTKQVVWLTWTWPGGPCAETHLFLSFSLSFSFLLSPSSSFLFLLVLFRELQGVLSPLSYVITIKFTSDS